jgi:hypothetical protein
MFLVYLTIWGLLSPSHDHEYSTWILPADSIDIVNSGIKYNGNRNILK